MTSAIRDFCRKLDSNSDRVKRMSKDFCEALGITTFAYVRIYHDGRTGWVTSNSDQDRFLLESESLDEDPVVDTATSLKKGAYLYFNDRKFPGCETFYQERARRFSMDHGMVLVKHQKDYLETCCYSGLLSKRPLYNLFLNEIALFQAFMEHFKREITHPLLNCLEEGIHLRDIKKQYGKLSTDLKRAQLLEKCGLKSLLKLSHREKECLLALRSGYTYQEVGDLLQISARTVEHYLNNIRNKLGLETRSELISIAEQLYQLKL